MSWQYTATSFREGYSRLVPWLLRVHGGPIIDPEKCLNEYILVNIWCFHIRMVFFKRWHCFFSTVFIESRTSNANMIKIWKVCSFERVCHGEDKKLDELSYWNYQGGALGISTEKLQSENFPAGYKMTKSSLVHGQAMAPIFRVSFDRG